MGVREDRGHRLRGLPATGARGYSRMLLRHEAEALAGHAAALDMDHLRVWCPVGPAALLLRRTDAALARTAPISCARTGQQGRPRSAAGPNCLPAGVRLANDAGVEQKCTGSASALSQETNSDHLAGARVRRLRHARNRSIAVVIADSNGASAFARYERLAIADAGVDKPLTRGRWGKISV